MANAEHLTTLRQGIDAWNAWREKEPRVTPDLIEADLRGASLWGASLWRARLGGANLSKAELNRANLNRADLRGADLGEANLGEANLGGANLERVGLGAANLTAADLSAGNLRWVYLREADLRKANLRRADLGDADLGRADLRGADLRGANLRGANLYGANLWKARLGRTNLIEANLMQANLIDAYLDGADLTGVKLWETRRAGWSIKNVICRVAFWDREGEEPTKYEEGEFEHFFAEKPRIILRYAGGISPIDLLALPLVVERLQAEYPRSVLQIHSMQNDAGGASVTITVEDRADRGTEVFAAEVEALRNDLLTIQHRLRSEESLRLEITAKYQAVTEDVLPKLLAKVVPKREIHIGQLTGPMAIEDIVMSQDTYNISGQAGAVGHGARAHNNTFQQIQGGIDLPKLADELGRLRGAMKDEGTGTREQDKAIGVVADAEEAAAKGDGPAALQYLKSAGEWTLGIAEKIGVPVVIEALKRAM
jgi:uncharacterized protein YjbI with pentapeptide repeats